jgi:MFS family permease
VTVATILFAGLLMGPFFPNLMAILLDHVPVEVSGRAVGVIFAGASIGWTLIPLAIGAIAKRAGDLHRGFRVAVVDAILLLLVVVGHLLYANAKLCTHDQDRCLAKNSRLLRHISSERT